MQIELEADHLRDSRYAVRPKGQLGTCGWHPVPWTVAYVNARSEADAVKKARALSAAQRGNGRRA